MRGPATSLRRSYLGALVLPALLVNGFCLVLAWPGTPAGDELLAEVEVLRELSDHGEQDRLYVVHLERLVKGQSASSVLNVRFPADALPEGLGLASRRRSGERFPEAGERIFVVLRRNGDCLYSVEHFWLGAPQRPPRPEAPRLPVTAAG